jgi:hypothetical protein
VVTRLLILGIVLDAVGIAGSVRSLRFLDDLSWEGEWVDPSDCGDVLVRGIDLLQTVLAVASTISLLIWLHRAHLNLIVGRLQQLTYTPGGAVLSFFIPIVHLVRPFYVMKEIWSGSAHLSSGDPARSWREAKTSPVIACWWLFFLGTPALGRVAGGQLKRAKELADFVTGIRLSMFSSVMAVINGVLTIVLVHQITTMQEHARRRSTESATSEPFAVEGGGIANPQRGTGSPHGDEAQSRGNHAPRS